MTQTPLISLTVAWPLRFPSKLDGNPCFALFEGRGDLLQAGDPVDLTDPPIEALTNVTVPGGIQLDPALVPIRR